MSKIKDIIHHLESFAPPAYQEGYDNAQLITGDAEAAVTGVLIALDCVESVVEEAVKKNCNLIVAHHPIVFKGLKSFTGKDYVERTIINAIKKDVAIYAIHTNLDNVALGVNKKISDKIGLLDTRVLLPKKHVLSKLETFVPVSSTETVLEALHQAGAGRVGAYENCSFRVEGTGSFKGKEGSHPTIGSVGVQEEVQENKLELLFPSHLEGAVTQALKAAHPYEEVAYYVSAIENKNEAVGSGMLGRLPSEMEALEFLNLLKEKMQLQCIRHTTLTDNKIQKVAVCGGAGSFLLEHAKRAGADVFVTADFKYHEFFDAEKQLVIADIGHYESEVYTKELIYEIINKKFTKFAVNLSEENTNPISYL